MDALLREQGEIERLWTRMLSALEQKIPAAALESWIRPSRLLGVEGDRLHLAATNQDLEQAVAAGRFREDLYYRLNVIQIVVPPLGARSEEIPLLVNYFTQGYSGLFHRQGFTVPPEVMERLVQQSYPGNVRQLENILKRMIALDDPLLTRTSLPRVKTDEDGNGTPKTVEAPALSLKQIAREAALAAEREAMFKVLEQTRWNRVKAAKLLKISYRALLYKIKQVGFEPPGPSIQSRV